MKAIIATNNLNVIGVKGKLPWKSKEDLNHFKEMTMGGTILVGYNTAQNLPPLKGRTIIVDDKDTIMDCSDIDWCCGGRKTYEKYCHLFTELHVSIIDDYTLGDTIFPELKNMNDNCTIHYYKYKID